MTDRDKLLWIAHKFGAQVKEMENSAIIAGRRFYFTKTGEVEKILDYKTHIKATPIKGIQE